jgi:RNA polymerase sigma factor (sigma-70 family)
MRTRPLTDEEELRVTVSAAAAGDEKAWSMLVARFGAMIRAVARRHRLGDVDQEEVVQRTWLRLVERIDSLRDPGAMPGWLATTAHRECLRLKQSRAREVLDDELDVTGEQTPVEELVIAAERAQALHGALERLPEREQAILRLQLTQPGLGYGEIGGALAMPVGSIGPTRGRSLARLRRDAQLLNAIAA